MGDDIYEILATTPFGDLATFCVITVLVAITVKKLFDAFQNNNQPANGNPVAFLDGIGGDIANMLDPTQNTPIFLAFMFVLVGSVHWAKFPTGGFVLAWLTLMVYYGKINMKLTFTKVLIITAILAIYITCGFAWVIFRFYAFVEASENDEAILAITNLWDVAQQNYWKSYTHFVYWPFSIIHFVIIDLGRRVYDMLSYQIISIFVRMIENRQNEIRTIRNLTNRV